MTLRAELFPIWRGGKAGYSYNITLDDELILQHSHDPEHDVARELLARGITGMVELVDGFTGKPRTKINIERAARLTVIEENRGGLRIRKYREHPGISAPAAEGDAPGLLVLGDASEAVAEEAA
jgi:hypothetical protein